MTTMKTLITSQNSLLTILRSRSASILVALTLGVFALAPVPTAFGVVPAPDGGYPGGNTAEGDNALFNLTTGTGNTAIGSNALLHNTVGRNNTAEGDVALENNTTDIDNTAIGVFALTNNTIGNSNTAIGFFALFGNTTGNNNTANGVEALINNSTGSNNTANGVAALFNNTTGGNNTANGVDALAGNGSGGNNTANGFNALFSNTIGNFNTADDVNALFGNTTGNNNTASGEAALFRSTTGSSNIAVGVNAGSNLTIGSNNIHIGNVAVAGEARTIRVGMQGTQTRTFIAGISGVAVAGSAVVANANGQLGIAASSERFKDEIKPMDKASEAILALQPVTFHYKKEIDPTRTLQFGLVAEDVEKVNPALVMRDKEGKPYSVRYDQVNAMLLNEFLKEHRKVQALEASAAQQQKQIEALTAGLQKVSAQLATASPSRGGLEARKPAPQVVKNP